jgi:hypothetical protein
LFSLSIAGQSRLRVPLVGIAVLVELDVEEVLDVDVDVVLDVEEVLDMDEVLDVVVLAEEVTLLSEVAVVDLETPYVIETSDAALLRLEAESAADALLRSQCWRLVDLLPSLSILCHMFLRRLRTVVLINQCTTNSTANRSNNDNQGCNGYNNQEMTP